MAGGASSLNTPRDPHENKIHLSITPLLALLRLVAALLAVGALESAESVPKPARPNILFILGDDLGIIFSQLGNEWIGRDDASKLNQRGELFDMTDAPFAEKPVPENATNPATVTARKRLRAVLAELNPATGKTDPAPKKAK